MRQKIAHSYLNASSISDTQALYQQMNADLEQNIAGIGNRLNKLHQNKDALDPKSKR